jgi:nucleoside-diphosphate-sugar epimerase
LTYFDAEAKSFGEYSDKIFDDYSGVEELTTLPAAAFHRNVDEIVLNTGTRHADSVRTAIVCPPTIYGQGRGPVSGRGRQVYVLASMILKEQYCPRINQGFSRWNHVHIKDLSKVYGLLVQAALDQRQDSEVWGRHGYFLTENGEHVWGELSAAIGKEVRMQGYTDGILEMRGISFEEARDSPFGFEAASWGMNSRGTASRARKVLGWNPVENSLLDETPVIVRSEAARLGMQPRSKS